MLRVSYAKLLKKMAYSYPFNQGQDKEIQDLFITKGNYDFCPHELQSIGLRYTDWIRMARITYRYRRLYLRQWARENHCRILHYDEPYGIMWFEKANGSKCYRVLNNPDKKGEMSDAV